MEKEQVAVDEAVETVAEQNTRAYSKTVWNESTPITADKLNKIENGIASALPIEGGTLTGSITLPNSTKGQIKQTLTNGTATPTLYITTGDNLRVGSADISNVCIYSKTNPKTAVNGSTYTLYHTGNKPTANDVGALPLSGGTLTGNVEVPGESKFYNGAYTDPWHGEICSIKASGNVGIGGALKVNEGLIVDGKLAFSNIGTGGGLHANIHNLALHNRTGNGQMMTADNLKIYVGNPSTALAIESNTTPDVKIGNSLYKLYHTGNKPTAWDIGAMSSNAPTFEGNMIQVGPSSRDWIYHINADMGSLHIAPHNNGNNDWDSQIMFDRSGQIFCNGRKKVPTWDGNPTHYMFRYGSGLGGANGYITFSY